METRVVAWGRVEGRGVLGGDTCSGLGKGRGIMGGGICVPSWALAAPRAHCAAGAPGCAGACRGHMRRTQSVARGLIAPAGGWEDNHEGVGGRAGGCNGGLVYSQLI